MDINKKLRVLTHRWHCGHQYELWKLPYDFTLASGFGGISDSWNYEERPMPANASFKNYKDINPLDYDFVLLHFDESCLTPGHPLLSWNWGNSFRWLRENINLPKVAICHGTPQYYGMGVLDYVNKKVKILETRRQELVNYLGDIPVTCNSNQAREEWRFNKSRTIWHGFDSSEYNLTEYNRDVLTLSSGALQGRPHYRGYFYFKEILNLIDADKVSHTSVKIPPSLIPKNTNSYAVDKFKCYVNMIRDYSVYLNPTVLSPMPRSRAEAMLCGLVTVNYDSHDASMFIKNGKNGFIFKESEEAADIINYLLKRPNIIKEIGKSSRETAIKEFSSDRFLSDWKKVIAAI